HTDTHRHTVPDALMRLEAVIHERKRGTFFFLVLLLLFPLLPFSFSLSLFLSLSLPPSLCFSLFPLLPFSFSFSLSLSVSPETVSSGHHSHLLTLLLLSS